MSKLPWEKQPEEWDGGDAIWAMILGFAFFLGVEWLIAAFFGVPL